MEPRISIVTLGVDELERAARFYEAMGLERHRKFTDGVAFFQMGGMILALWPRQELARDVGEQHFSAPGTQESAGQCGTVLAYNARTEEETHEILARAQLAGG